NKMQYHNYYFHTYPQTLAQLKRVQKMIEASKIENPKIALDFANGQQVLDHKVIADNGIVYKGSLIATATHEGHPSTAFVYFPQEMKAFSVRYERDHNGQQLAEGKPKPQG